MMRGGKHSSVGGLDVAKSTPTIRHLCTAVRHGLAGVHECPTSATQLQTGSSIITGSVTATMR